MQKTSGDGSFDDDDDRSVTAKGWSVPPHWTIESPLLPDLSVGTGELAGAKPDSADRIRLHSEYSV